MAKASKLAKEGALNFIPPCLAKPGRPPAGPNWVHEIKYDGYRLQAHVASQGLSRIVRFFTRNGYDWTDRLACLVPSLESLPARVAIMDGEAVSFDSCGVSSFELLHSELKRGRKARITMIAFDLLHIDGKDLRALPLIERKSRLKALVDKPTEASGLQYCDHIVGDGMEVLKKTCELDLEGIVSKRRDQPYRSGRSGDWIKAKCVLSAPFVVIGHTPQKTQPQSVGALVLGYYNKGLLTYAGRVGTGFTAREAKSMWEGLQAICCEPPPFVQELTRSQREQVRWVTPILVAQVEYRGWTSDRLLRHPTFKCFREDKSPQEVGCPNGLLR